MLSRTRSDPAVTAIAPTPTLGRCCCDLSPHCLCLGPCSVYEETRMLAPRLPRAGVLFAAKSAVAGPSSPSPLLRRPVAAAAPFQAPLGGPAQSRRSAATESQQSNSSSVVAQFATVDPVSLSGRRPHRIQNLLAGEWRDAKHTVDVLDPLNGEPFIQAPDTKEAELPPFVASLARVPKSGLHNPLKNPERYLLYGEVLCRAAELLHREDVAAFFTKCIQRTMPKSKPQAEGEIHILRDFCATFSGDSVQTLCSRFTQPVDHHACGQITHGYRWPYGAVAVLSPFNFPLKVAGTQLLSAAMVGNKPLLTPESTQGLPLEQFIRFLIHCGMPPTDVDFLNCRGPVTSSLLRMAAPSVRMVHFTGPRRAAKLLTQAAAAATTTTGGGGGGDLFKVEEDDGVHWKILGPDVSDLLSVARQCDADAYALSGQASSAQSLLFAHSNWVRVGLLQELKRLAKTRGCVRGGGGD
eukprot:GHVU01163810.1.p1 GENE.GHVU01163810.1~~GHVU01163810.1.p1  ORF type:complete len:467 (-),score=82.04 GHVU01163810.1:133-1533(-)